MYEWVQINNIPFENLSASQARTSEKYWDRDDLFVEIIEGDYSHIEKVNLRSKLTLKQLSKRVSRGEVDKVILSTTNESSFKKMDKALRSLESFEERDKGYWSADFVYRFSPY